MIQEASQAASKYLIGKNLESHPLLWKSKLYKVIKRLIDDPSPENTFRRGVYTSVTGGGSGSKALFFATDVHENRRQRARFGELLRTMGIVSDGDWVVTTHFAGHLYRSLDLTLEILENAGASVLGAGPHMTAAEVVQLIKEYRVNVLSGDSTQIVYIVQYISTLSTAEREKLMLDKIIYTSEALTPLQRMHILKVLGPVQICSVIGSAEAGPYGVSCSQPTARTDHYDFIFDTRTMVIEIFPDSVTEGDNSTPPEPLPEGQQGLIAQTSLMRLRNPLIRYLTGDIGSVHALPPDASPSVPLSERQYLRVLRFRGRDRRSSFEWEGCYFEFEQFEALVNDPCLRILQWQVVLENTASSPKPSLEVRLLCVEETETEKDAIVERLEKFFYVNDRTRNLFKVAFLKDLGKFERSRTGRKIIRLVDNVK